ncbi:hypothetical protein VTN96DRAFT_10185 [Rasamsonia emersonii]
MGQEKQTGQVNISINLPGISPAPRLACYCQGRLRTCSVASVATASPTLRCWDWNLPTVRKESLICTSPAGIYAVEKLHIE